MRSALTIDLSNVSLADVVAARGTDLRQIGNELHGPCPKCGGHDKRGSDRFRISTRNGRERFACRKCNPKGGDVVDLVRWLDGMSFAEAVRQLSVPVRRDAAAQPRTPAAPRDEIEIRPDEWLCAFEKVVDDAHAALIGGRCDQALNYLAARGITREMIERYKIGYNAHSRKVAGKWWIDRGIVIPRYYVGILYAVNVRRRADDLALDAMRGGRVCKYRQAAGSTVRAPFNGTPLVADIERAALPVVFVVGGEFDAMLVTEHAPAGSIAITLGGETTTPPAELLGALKGRRVVVMTDNDEAGDVAAAMWQGACSGAERVCVPSGKDATEFFQGAGAQAFAEWLAKVVKS